MNAKILLAGLVGVASALLVIAAEVGPPPMPAGTEARFTLTAGQRPMLGVPSQPTMYRLNTYTGQTWILVPVSYGEATIQVWMPLDELTGDRYQRATEAMEREQKAK